LGRQIFFRRIALEMGPTFKFVPAPLIGFSVWLVSCYAPVFVTGMLTRNQG